MTYWLSTDELSIGLFVKFLYEALESHYKTYHTLEQLDGIIRFS